MVKAVGLAVYRRPERGKGSHQAFVAAGFFAARSLPVGLSDSLTGLVTADPDLAFDLSAAAAAGPGLVAAVGSLVVAVFLFVAGSVGSVFCCCCLSCLSCLFCLFCSFFCCGDGEGEGYLVSCFLVLRFSFSRNRNCLSPLYFAGASFRVCS